LIEELFELPVVGAPLAGGPSTPELAAAVSEAGGLGFVAAGYKSADDVEREIAAVKAATPRPFGVNIFFPARLEADGAAIAEYASRLEADARRYGAECGEPHWSDDDWNAKIDLIARERPSVVSFTFGCPDREIVSGLQDGGASVWCTVTTPEEGEIAVGTGVDALVVQGAEAGGHQSSFDDTDDAPLGVLALLQVVRTVTDRPLVAAGGIASGRGIAAVVRAGAVAAQIGSGLLLTPEAGTSAAHRQALGRSRPTALTRAFTGRRARGIVNRFLTEHDAFAPRGYPHIHYVTAPLRAAARAAGDPDGINLWAGQAYRLAEAVPAGELVTRWTEEARVEARARA
jgi:nitronate monooxygenase